MWSSRDFEILFLFEQWPKMISLRLKHFWKWVWRDNSPEMVYFIVLLLRDFNLVKQSFQCRLQCVIISSARKGCNSLWPGIGTNSCCIACIYNRMYICNKWHYQRSVSSIIWLLMYLVCWSGSKSHNAFELSVEHLCDCQMNEKRRQATAREKRRMEKLNHCIEDLRVLICPLLKVSYLVEGIISVDCWLFTLRKAFINCSFLVTNESENIGMYIRKITISGVDLQ